MNPDLEKLMRPEELQSLGIASMTAEQQQLLLSWGTRMYSLGQQIIEYIDDIKYDGRLVILNDGTRWEVDSGDASTAKMWSSSSKVLITDNTMYNLDETEKVEVQEES